MKRTLVILLVCILLLVVVLVGDNFNRIYMVNIDNLYTLRYEGNKITPVLEQLPTKEGISYLFCPEAVNTNKVTVLVYVPPLSPSREVNYVNVFLLTGYTSIP
jgi:hypothetical protein